MDKTAVIVDYGDRYGLRTLIETGLYRGVGSGMAAGFPTYIALDHDEENVQLAQDQGFDARCGDSGFLLREALAELHEPALFWLDAHGIDCNQPAATAAWPGWGNVPLLREIRAIVSWPHAYKSVVLIDDMPLMAQWIGIGTSGEPEEQTFEKFLDAQPIPWQWETRDGIMRLAPQ